MLIINKISAYLFVTASATLPARACSSSVPVESFAFYLKSGETVELLSDGVLSCRYDNEKLKKL